LQINRQVTFGRWRLLLCASALCLIALQYGCGWQLRGTQPGAASGRAALPTELHILQLERSSRMTKSLHKVLRQKNIALSPEASTVLVIERENFDKRPLAVNESGVAAQYQLTLTVRYHYQLQDGITTDSRSVRSWRSYDFDAQLIVAKQQEEQALIDEMEEELAYRILDGLPR